MMTFFESPISGNCYKIVLLLRQLRQPFTRVIVDIDQGETRTPEFLANNPNGKVPMLQLEDGRCLSESLAILWFLAEGTAFLSNDPWQRVRTLQWLSFEQYEIENNIAVLRNRARQGAMTPVSWQGEEAKRFANGSRALHVLDDHFGKHDFAVGDRYGVADIALYGYTHLAQDAGYDLSAYAGLSRWLAAVRDQMGYLPMNEAMTLGEG